MQRRRILVIENDTALRGVLKLHLVNAGYEVLTADDAIDGRRLQVTGDPDLLVVDARIEMISTLAGEPSAPGLPVVLISDKSFHADELLRQVRGLL